MRITEQYLDDSGKSAKLGYVNTTAWVTKGLFLLFLPQSSNQALSYSLRPLLFSSFVCVYDLPARGWEGRCVCWLESVEDRNREGPELPRDAIVLK